MLRYTSWGKWRREPGSWKEEETEDGSLSRGLRILEIEANSWQPPFEECRSPPCTRSLVHLFVLSSFSFALLGTLMFLIWLKESAVRILTSSLLIAVLFNVRCRRADRRAAGCKRYLIRNLSDITFKFRQSLPSSPSHKADDSLCRTSKKNPSIFAIRLWRNNKEFFLNNEINSD